MISPCVHSFFNLKLCHLNHSGSTIFNSIASASNRKLENKNKQKKHYKVNSPVHFHTGFLQEEYTPSYTDWQVAVNWTVCVIFSTPPNKVFSDYQCACGKEKKKFTQSAEKWLMQTTDLSWEENEKCALWHCGAEKSNADRQTWMKKWKTDGERVLPWRMFLCSSSSAVGLWLSRLKTENTTFKGWYGSI